MKYNPDIHHRRTLRLKGYDYSQKGAYFVTFCVQNRECLFGKIISGKLIMNEAGLAISTIWNAMPKRFPSIELDEFLIMPNHVHGIIHIVGAPLVGALYEKTGNPNRAGNRNRAATRAAPTLGNIVGAFKSKTTVEYIRNVADNNWQPFNKRLWQRGYYEHIIRTEGELNRTRQYILDNPANWETDENNPALL